MSGDRRQSDTASFNSLKFKSSQARPKEVRNVDRSRSPQRDRIISGRRERNEGERQELERGGYDSYRPGQSPSKVIIPAPVRTFSSGSTFSPQIPSTLNESRRSSSVRSPSDSSPYRPSDRTVPSRTSTASELPTRPPEVGIRILGLAAKADEERKLREEAAKIYMAKVARQKGNAISEQADNMEMAHVSAPSEASADSTGLSWKDKAEATEATTSKQESSIAVSANDPSLTMAQLLAQSIKKIIDEVTDVSSLKYRRNTAVAKLDKAKAEFEKFRDHHEKFPSIKETQNNAKKVAEKEYKKANHQLESKDSSLQQLAVHVAEQIIPSILGGVSNSQEQQNTQDRIDALESTCQKYDQLLRDQKSYLEENMKAAAQESERKYNAMAEDLRLLQEEVAKQKPRQDRFFQRQNEFAIATQNMTKILGVAKEDIAALASIQIPSDLNQQLQKLSELDQLRAKVQAVEERSTTTDSGLTNLTTNVNTLGNSVDTLQKTLEARDVVGQTLAEEQDNLRGTVSGIDSRIGAVEGKLLDTEELDMLKQRMTRIETAPPLSVAKPTMDPAIVAQMASLEEKIESMSSQLAKLEDQNGVLNLKATMDQFGTTLATTVDRLAQMETQAKTLEAVQKKVKPQAQQSTSPNVAVYESWLAAVEESHRSVAPNSSIERRISALEQKWGQTTQQKASNETEPANNLPEQVLKLQEDLASVQSSVDVMLEITGATVKEIVDEELAHIKPRLAAVEVSLKTIEECQESIQTSVNSLQESQRYSADQIQAQNQVILDAKNSMVGAAAGNAIDIIRAQDIFAPASLDEKFTSSLNSVNKSLMEHIEANSQATGNLQQRMDNLNTSEVLLAMVDNINQTYPSLRSSEMALQSHGSQLSTLDLRIKALQKQVEEVRESRQAPVSVASTSPAPPKQDDGTLKRIRIELDELSKDTIRLQRLERDVTAFKGETSTVLAGIDRQTTVLSEELATTFFEFKNSGEDLGGKVNDLAERFNTLIEKVNGIEKKVDNVTQRQQQPITATPRAQPATITRQAFQSPGPVHQPSAASATRRSSTSTNRQPSIASDTASTAGKRKYKQLNGNSPSSPRRANGLKHGSPTPKRARRTKFDDDSDEDPDYEDEGDPQPGISADEDE
ncbi:hypothetical protein BKA61DRAFT_670043 [Leptodontidium sp. MPI-SDFR-AT-0119]|nr:hypothetical protein BKA61DRAFT_670043 [Leptodontidium sp. MPI-SDFR-AT-0119]